MQLERLNLTKRSLKKVESQSEKLAINQKFRNRDSKNKKLEKIHKKIEKNSQKIGRKKLRASPKSWQ